MSNNKQSSIDILCGKLAMKLGIPQAITFYIDHQEEIAEAKAMHKEEHRETWDECLLSSNPEKTFEDHYNETFSDESNT